MASLGHPTCCLGLTCTPHESWRCPLRGERSCRDVRLGGQENVAVKGSRHVYPDDSSHKLYTLNVLLVVIAILCCIITAANLCIVSNNTRPSKVWIITALCVCVCVCVCVCEWASACIQCSSLEIVSQFTGCLIVQKYVYPLCLCLSPFPAFLVWLACKQLPAAVHVNDMYYHMSS